MPRAPASARFHATSRRAKALTIGRQFGEHLKGCVYDAERARVITELTGAQVAEAVREFRDGAGLRTAKRTGNVYRWMSVAVFFVEHLRVQGFPDVIARLSQVWERVGRGEAFDTAFAAVFEQGLDELELNYVKFMTSTEGDVAARLAASAYATDCAPAS